MRNAFTRLALPLLLSTAITLSGCTSVKADDLMDGVVSGNVNDRTVDSVFTGSMADFSIDLFKSSITRGENSLISPLSVMLALAMTANGADNETLAQMEALLGGGIPIDDLNGYLYSYVESLPSSEKSTLDIANSIWFRDAGTLQVNSDFLQTNADYYGAAAYKAAFDTQTVKDINDWVNTNTNGMIDKILTEINESAQLYLINAVMFDAEWQNVYYKNDVKKGDFTNITGTTQRVDFMHSTESLYLDDGLATGFIKRYANGYSFAALLPNEDVSIEDYIDSLTGAGFADTLESSQVTTVYASMPKFEYEYTVTMNDALSSLGIPDAFDAAIADFSKMAVSSNDNIYIDEVLHKTYISVDELGTKAGAVTMVSMNDASAELSDIKTVQLDRPFVYAIIDSATNLPIFIGTVMTIS